MLSKDIEGIVDTNPELNLGSQVARNAANDAIDDGRPGRYKSSGRSDSDQACNDTTAEADSAPFLLQAVVHQTPGEATDASRDMGHNAGQNCTQVRAESATTVKAEPAHPEEDSSENDVRYVVWAVWKTVGLVISSSPSEHEGIGQSSSAGGNMHRRATGKVEAAELEGPAVRVPGPVSYRVIDDSCPNEYEHESREHPATVGSGTDGEGRPVDKACQFPTVQLIFHHMAQGTTYVIAANMPWYRQKSKSGILVLPTLG